MAIQRTGAMVYRSLGFSLLLGLLLACDDASAAETAVRAPIAADEEGAPRFNPRCEDIESKNLIRNSSFECGQARWASLGKPTGWGGELSGLVGTLEPGSAWHGEHSLRIDLGPGITPVTCFDVWPPARVHQHAPLAANIGWMPVEAGRPLTLSAYLRASVPGMKARFLFRFSDSALAPVKQVSHEVVLSREWTRYAVTQEALGADVCIAIGPDATGMSEAVVSCWIDAIQLERGAVATPFQTREAVELEFSTDRYGNLYDTTERPVLCVYATNGSDVEAAVTLTMETEDYFGNVSAQDALALRVPAGVRAVAPWELAVAGTGYYRARIRWVANGRECAETVVFSIIQPYLHDDSPFGLNHPAASRKQLELHARAGIRWVRNWSVNWEWVEPRRGEISWQVQDAQLNHVSTAGMKTLVVFPNPSTNWASSAPSSVDASRWYRLAYRPIEPQGLFGFTARAVERYKNACGHWEFLNEPLWVPDFCLPRTAGYTVADYIRLLRGAHQAIKTANPDSVIVAGLSIDPKSPLGDQFIREGGLAYCDRLNLHPYGGFSPPEDFIADMERIQSVMDAYGRRSPIWATETAYYAADDKPWTPWVIPPGHFSAQRLLPDERTCADFIVRHALVMLAHGVEKVFYHEPIEGPVNMGAMDIGNPFFSPNAVPAKPYVAMSALANLLGPAPDYAGPASFPAVAAADRPRRYGYAFQAGDRAVVAVWASDDEDAAAAIPLAPGIAAYNVVGNPLSSPVLLGRSPIYLVSAARPAREVAHTWHACR